MKQRPILYALAALTLPSAALALPSVGDALGTDAATVRAALESQGCPVTGFEAEDGKIEAKCRETATGTKWEIYIDPATGRVARVSQDD